MKKVLSICLSLALLLACMGGAATAADAGNYQTADIGINIYNAQSGYMYSANVEMEGLPIRAGGVIMAPIRSLAAYLQLNMFFGNGLFDIGIPSLLLSNGEKGLEFGITETKTCYAGGRDLYEKGELPVSTLLINGRLYVPVEFVAEYFGFIVSEHENIRHFNPYNHSSSSGLVVSNFTVLELEDFGIVRDGRKIDFSVDVPLELLAGDRLAGEIALGDAAAKVREVYGIPMYEQKLASGQTSLLCYGGYYGFSSIAQLRLHFAFDENQKLVGVKSEIW